MSSMEDTLAMMRIRTKVLSETDRQDPSDPIVFEEPETTDAALEAACNLVQELTHQLQSKDAPPSNTVREIQARTSSPSKRRDMTSPTSRRDDDLSERTSEGSRQSSPTAELHAVSSSMSADDNNDNKLGHEALTSLCTWTLEQVQGGVAEADVAEAPLTAAVSDTEPLPPPTPKQGQERSPHRKANKLRRFFSSRSSSKPTMGASEQEEKKQEEEQASLAAPPPQLQQFGSEYARHLSNTPLAPQYFDSASSRYFPKKSHRRGSAAHRLLSEADAAIQAGALLDICVTYGHDPAPPGYYTLTYASGLPLALQHGKVHLHVKKEPNWDKAAQRPCITAVTLISPDRDEFVPPGFCVAKVASNKNSSVPANLGTKEQRLFCAFRRSREGNPITGLTAIRPDLGDAVPTGYTVMEQSPRNLPCLISQAPPVFLALRQRLANLECLRPVPMVRSVVNGNATRLQAYYSTGGIVVPANVGCFHIMDRTTHSLLSPSSVSNRLQLIELSRRRASGGDDIAQTDESASDVFRGTSNDDSFRGTSNDDSFAGFASRTDSIESDSIALSFSRHDSRTDFASLSEPYEYHGEERDTVPDYILSNLLGSAVTDTEASELQQCLEAFNFIPSVDTAVCGLDQMAATGRLSVRATLLTPLLTACYTRHGGAALVAVEGLTSLLLKTDFFADDVDQSEERSDKDASTRLTLLDLSIQAVCDVATTSAQETSFGSCVEFVENAVRFSQAHLNTRTIGYVIRFYLFVFYFGASVPTASSRWPNPTWRASSSSNDDPNGCFDQKEDVPMLLDPRIDGQGYLPGGAPQSAVLGFKELISLSIVRLGKVSVNGMFVLARSASEAASSLSEGERPTPPDTTILPFIDNLLSSLVDEAVNHVEIANYTQLALHQIQRSGGSELFWHEMVNECGLGLFGKDENLDEIGKNVYVVIFAVMACLVKVSSGKMRSNSQTSDLLPRDISSKLLALELLLHFLEYWSDEQEAVNGITPANGSARSIRTLAFSIRRMVVPTLLTNTRAALENPMVFSRVIRVLSELWCSPVYRRHCKAELGILMDHFALRMLQLGPQLIASKRVHVGSEKAAVSLLLQQVELIKEIKCWFSSDPKDVIELYLNYDTDIASQLNGPIQLLSGTQWKIFQRLSSGLSNIAEQCGELIGEQIRESQLKIDYGARVTSTRPSSPTGELIETLASIQDTQGDVSNTTAIREAARLLRTTSLEAILQIVKSLAISAAAATSPEFTALLLSWTPPDSPIAYEKTFSFESNHSEDQGDMNSPSSHQGDTEAESDEVTQFWRDAIAAEQKQRLLDSSPSNQEAHETAMDIADKKSLKKAIEYLIACNALTPAPRDIATYLWIHKEQLDPTDLGMYLGECGTGAAETEYWNSIRHSYVRAISFDGMNVEEGLRHFLTNSGFKLPGEAQKIDRIMNTFAQCYFEDNAGDTQRCPFKEEDTVFVLSFAIIMLNTDLHKSHSGTRKTKKTMTKTEFSNNLRGVAQGEDIDREYLSVIYDSIETTPIAMHNDELNHHASSEDRHHVLQGMLNNVRTADALLRGLAVHDFKAASLQDFTSSLEYSGQDALSDLTRSCVSKTWYQWHGVVNTGLETAHLDPQGMYPSVEILLYALSVTVCLDMPTERTAFMSQLGRLKAFEEHRQGRWVRRPDYESFRNEEWYLQLEQACSGSDDRKLWALREFHSKLQSLQSAMLVDVQNNVDMTKAVSQLKDGDFLLLDPARSLVRCSDLVKKSARTGRSIEYRFFLFSDVLLYAKEEDGRYKIHEELPLHLMKVIDWFPPSQKNRQTVFEVHHPRKSFLVLCGSFEERKSWVRDIRAAISLEMEHKMKQEAARLAAYANV